MRRKILKRGIIAVGIIAIIIGMIEVSCDKEKKNDSIYEEDKSYHEKEETAEKIFGKYEKAAEQKIQSLTLDEKIGGLFLVRFPEKDAKEIVQRYQFGGYILFERDFKDQTKEEIREKIRQVQVASKIPLLIAVDEEGGKLVRASSNQKLREERFYSPQELYEIGGLNQIWKDTVEKSYFLEDLGINVNLAPVVDVSTNENDYIYARTLGKDTELTKAYAKTVIEASKQGRVSYTLKHFPGYGSNLDTHKGVSTDTKTYEQIQNQDFPPFIAGIEAGAEAVMISHNTAISIDPQNPASLSKKVHEILRDELHFTGVIITDGLDMGAVSQDEDAVLKAIEAGNNLLIVTNYQKSIQQVKAAVKNGRISEKIIEERLRNVLAWKYAKGLM